MRALAAACSLFISFALNAQVRGDISTSSLTRGQGGTFSVVFENRGTVALADVTARLLLQSEGFSNDSSGQILEISGPGWRCEDPSRRTRVMCRRNGIEPSERVSLAGRIIAPQSNNLRLFFHLAAAEPFTGAIVEKTLDVAEAPGAVDLSLTSNVVREPDPKRAAVSIIATAANRSLQTATDVVLRITADQLMPARVASGAGWNCRVVSFDAICTRPALAPGETSSVTFRHYAYDVRNVRGTLHLLFEGADVNRVDNEILIESRAPDSPIPIPEDFELLLLPIATVDTPGALGSLWRTTFTLHNANDEPLMGLGAFDLAYPFHTGCMFPVCPSPHSVPAHSSVELSIKQPAGPPGALLWVRKDRPDVAFQLRVQDVSRQAMSWGTEIPVVRTGDLWSSTLRLLDVPLQPRFRQTLRVYDLSENASPAVIVRMIDARVGDVLHEELLVLTTKPTHLDELYRGFRLLPAYAEIAYLSALSALQDAGRIRIEIEPLVPGMRMWAFVSVTNNETQHVTLVTPQ